MTSHLKRRKPLRRVAMSTRRKATGPSDAVVELVLERASYSCEVLGCEMGDRRGLDWSIHHRAPRQMGGTRDPRYNSPSNLLVVCGSGTHGCHGLIESHRLGAYAAGWLVRRGQDPARMPVVIRGEGLVLLTPDGRYADPAEVSS